MNTILEFLRIFAPPAYVFTAVVMLLAGFLSSYLARRLRFSNPDPKERAKTEKTIATAQRIQEYLANADIQHGPETVR
jgi:K+-sensing histidine kinase KdpD